MGLLKKPICIIYFIFIIFIICILLVKKKEDSNNLQIINKSYNGENIFISIKIPNSYVFEKCKIVLDTGKQKYYRENNKETYNFNTDETTLFKFELGNINTIREIRIYTTNGKLYKIYKDINQKINKTITLN